MFELSVKTRFSAAHHLRGYPGSCADPHGHNWEVEVFVRGTRLDATGLLLDFRRLKATIRETLRQLDHRDLNDLDPFRSENPSSENIACLVYRALSKNLAAETCRVHRVTVRETPETSATYLEDGTGDSA